MDELRFVKPKIEHLEHTNSNTPILNTDRLLLRPFCEEDTKNVFEC